MTRIVGVEAWGVLDSRGTPTVACEVRTESGARGTASVPSGASTGQYEALELRDGGARYGGKGVRQAVANANGPLADAVVGLDATDQRAVDTVLRERRDLGANATLAVSLATWLAGAAACGIEPYEALGDAPLLPLPMVNVLSGGAHAGRTIDVQDFLVVPVGATSFAEAIEHAALVRATCAALADERGYGAALVADEGGLGLPLPTNRDALELLSAAIERTGLDAAVAIDVAATQLVVAGGYALAREDRVLRAEDLVEELVKWTADHRVVSIEDPLGDDDWAGWAVATQRLGRIQVLGDDLFVTDSARLARGIADGVANAVLVKPNQTGTLTGAADVVRAAHGAGYATVVSARSGETEDGWLADLAVGWRAGQIKVGSTMRSERTAKWNRLLRIEQRTGAPYAGRAAIERKA